MNSQQPNLKPQGMQPPSAPYNQYANRHSGQVMSGYNPNTPLAQMENFPAQPKYTQQKQNVKPDRQHNTMYMSSMEFSQPRIANIDNNVANFQYFKGYSGQQNQNYPSFNQHYMPQHNTLNQPLQKQRMMQQNQNLNSNNMDFQKKSIILSNNLNSGQRPSQTNENQQVLKPDSSQNSSKHKKNQELESIRKQLEGINNKMKRLGFGEGGSSKAIEGNAIRSNKNIQQGDKPMGRNGDSVAFSMIVNDSNRFQPSGFNQTKRPILSLEETYQKLKRKQTHDTSVNQPILEQPYLENKNYNDLGFRQGQQSGQRLSNITKLNPNDNTSKDFFNFTGKERRPTKTKTENFIFDSNKNFNENDKSTGVMNMNLDSYQPKPVEQTPIFQSNTPWNVNQQKQNNNFNVARRDSNNLNDSPRKKNLVENSKSFQLNNNQNTFNQFPNFGPVNPSTTQERSPVPSFLSSEPKGQTNNYIAPQTQQNQQPMPGFFKKKVAQPEYQISHASTHETESGTMPRTFSNEILIGQPQKIRKSDFKIGKKFGKGQFGEVELVQHKKTGFICALKTMSKKQIKEEKYEGQISRELSIQFYLAHRNITPLYGYFEDEENVYLLVEFCPDGHLLSVLKKVRRMEEQDVSPIIKQVCQGMDYIHKEKIIHRDIKPENLLFSFGVAKIVDFGWAVYRGMGLRKTASGSPLYYSPQIVMGEEYDEKIDIWDIGMMTYECLLGKVPFKVYTEMDLNRIATDEVTFPSYVDVTDQAQDFILKILQKKPEDRMTIREMLRHPFITKYSEKKLPVQIMTEIHRVLN